MTAQHHRGAAVVIRMTGDRGAVSTSGPVTGSGAQTVDHDPAMTSLEGWAPGAGARGVGRAAAAPVRPRPRFVLVNGGRERTDPPG